MVFAFMVFCLLFLFCTFPFRRRAPSAAPFQRYRRGGSSNSSPLSPAPSSCLVMSGFAAGVVGVQSQPGARHGVDRVSDCGAERDLEVVEAGCSRSGRHGGGPCARGGRGGIVGACWCGVDRRLARLPGCVCYTSRSLSASVP